MSDLRVKCQSNFRPVSLTKKALFCAFCTLVATSQPAVAISLAASSTALDSSFQTQLDQALERAISKKDFRLYGINNLSLRVPGIDPGHAAQTIQQCGVKRLKSPNQSKGTQLEFATRYNREMLSLCQQHKQGI